MNTNEFAGENPLAQSNAQSGFDAKTIDPRKRILAVVACLVVQFCVGILYIWSVLKGSVKTHYGWGEETNLIYAFMMFGFVFGNLIGGYFQDKTNPRLIATIGCAMFCFGIVISSFIPQDGSIILFFITYSIISGLGCGAAYGCMLYCLQAWFPTRRGFAAGLSSCAFALATVVFSPMFKALLSRFSVPNVFRIFGVACFIVALTACFFISMPASTTNKALLSGLTPKQMVKKGTFWCLVATCFFINAPWSIVSPIISDLGADRNLSELLITITVMITGISNASGRLSMASASDKMGRENAMGLMGVISLVAAIGLIWAQSYLCLVLVAFIAFAYGGPAAILPPMATDIGGKRYGGTNYGLALLSLGFSAVIFNALSKALVEATGAYTLTFIMAAITAVIPIGLMIVYKRLAKKQ